MVAVNPAITAAEWSVPVRGAPLKQYRREHDGFGRYKAPGQTKLPSAL